MTQTLVTIVVSIFASTGFWAFVSLLVQRHDAKLNARDKILLGLAQKQIIEDAEHYLAQGYITAAQYKSLNEYLYRPYKELGGNGTAEKIMMKIDKLEFKEG